MTWSNWAGNQTATPKDVVKITSEEMLGDLIRREQGPIRAVGSGHSFTPIAAVDGGTQLVLDALDHVQVDPSGPNRARIGAGASLGSIAQRLHDQGQAFANMGDIDDQALGGALATATHGTGRSFGCYSSMLTELTLVDGTGQRQVLSRADDESLFRALAVGIGTGGIVTEAVMQNTVPYRLDRRRYALPLSAMLEEFDTRMSAARNVEFYYITGSGQTVVFESNETSADLIARPPDKDQEGLRSLRMVARLLKWSPALRRALLGRVLKGHTSEHFIEDWHKAYPTDRDGIRFNESEFHLPIDAASSALKQVVDLVERQFPEVYFPMEIRTVAADDLYLSPFFGRDSVSIAVHHEAGQPFEGVMRAVQDIFVRHEGRPHWGKMHSLTAADLKSLYPHWDEAIEARRTLDPQGRFLTPYMQNLLGQ